MVEGSAGGRQRRVRARSAGPVGRAIVATGDAADGERVLAESYLAS